MGQADFRLLELVPTFFSGPLLQLDLGEFCRLECGCGWADLQAVLPLPPPALVSRISKRVLTIIFLV